MIKLRILSWRLFGITKVGPIFNDTCPFKKEAEGNFKYMERTHTHNAHT